MIFLAYRLTFFAAIAEKLNLKPPNEHLDGKRSILVPPIWEYGRVRSKLAVKFGEHVHIFDEIQKEVIEEVGKLTDDYIFRRTKVKDLNEIFYTLKCVEEGLSKPFQVELYKQLTRRDGSLVKFPKYTFAPKLI